mmetsp:Transcript_33917/g.75220  ORF Transcript_33917/g.75220 Transcript_33917/m.75220 type:complete len:297 (+) Transcript_33917:122-1012(+)|eukprot:CAMPEP_0202924158 /NCGR_PEP_ID=MMETSP1392-20130828/78818_1 /ASSEMBLY_ACC=CAM_ASM_000868 /TAXON_ID=225041 /ORGANISM="Chlamydomonas chlamydogama, Strain SAG 11-48b" /LENGTH=296 /DNA_ID=CAMNT_0049617873 /DNA_START=86 /DNA_END=976 /DNA_ORIENTATION=-
MSEAEGNLWHCDSVPVGNAVSGGKAGHILPGLLLFAWGTHWLFASEVEYYRLNKLGLTYTSKPYHTWPKVPARWPIEPAVKVMFPFLAILAELWLGHERYHALYCPERYSRYDHFDGDHINNWNHAAMYFSFIASGVADFAEHYLNAVPGTSYCCLSVAFAAEALLMGLHSKPRPLDNIQHQLLTGAMLGTVVGMVSELVNPHSLLCSWLRCGFMLLQGIWFLCIAHISFDHSPAWDDGPDGFHDAAPAMSAPLLFAAMCLLVLLALLLAHLPVALALRMHRRRAVTLPDPQMDAD